MAEDKDKLPELELPDLEIEQEGFPELELPELDLEATSEDVALPVSEEKTPEEYTEEAIQKNKLTKLGLYNDYSDVSLYDKPELSDEGVRQNADRERAENDKFLYEKELELEAKYENDIKETAINTGYPEEFVRGFNMVEKALPTKRRKTGYLAGGAGEFDRGVADIFRTVDGAVRFVKQGVVEGINLAEKAIGKEGAQLTSLDDRPTLWSDLADVYDRSADAGYDIPDDVMGDVVGGMARIVPDLAITMVAPEMKLGKISQLTKGAIKSVPRFPTVLAVKEASAEYMKDPNDPFAIPVGAFKGFEEGLVMESMGLIGKEAKMLADGLGAGKAMSETAAAVTNGTLFGGHAIVSDPEVYRDGDVDWDLAKRRFGSGFGMGLAFHLGGITKGVKDEMSPSASKEIANSAIKRGYAEYMTSDREAVRKAFTEVKDPRALRKVSNEYWRKADLAESEVERNQYLMAKTGIDNLISRKMFADYVANNPDEMKKAIEEDKSLSQKEVEFFNKKIDETVEDYEAVNKFNEEKAKIEEKVVEPEKAETAREDLQVKADFLKEQGEDVSKMTVDGIESRFEALKTETDIVEPKVEEVDAEGLQGKLDEMKEAGVDVAEINIEDIESKYEQFKAEKDGKEVSEEVVEFKEVEVPKEVVDLAQKIAKGEKATTPEELQTQANFPKEIEAELTKIKEAEAGIDYGVGEAYTESEDLKLVGSSKEYSDYIKGVFPKSKVQDVVFHGTKSKFEEFSDESLGGFTGAPSAQLGHFFATNPSNAKYYAVVSEASPFGVAPKEGFIPVERTESERQKLKELSDEIYEEYKTSLKEYNSLFNELDSAKKEVDFISTKNKLKDKIVDILNRMFSRGYVNLAKKLDGLLRTVDELTFGLEASRQKMLDAHKKVEDAYERSLGFGKIEETELKGDQSVKKVKLNMENPFVFDFGGEKVRQESFFDIISEAKELGHDGVVIKNTFDPLATDVHVVFDTKNIHTLGAKADIDAFNKRKKGVSEEVEVSKEVEKAAPVETEAKPVVPETPVEKAPEVKVEEAEKEVVKEKKPFRVADVVEEGTSENEVVDRVINESEDVGELASTYLQEAEKPSELSYIEQVIKDHMKPIKRSSFQEFGDLTSLEGAKQIQLKYFKKEGSTIDQIVTDIAMSDAGKNLDITANDVIDFINKHPNGVESTNVGGGRSAEVALRYKEVTGKKLTADIAKDILKQDLVAEEAMIKADEQLQAEKEFKAEASVRKQALKGVEKADLERSNKIAEEIGVLEKRGKDKMAEGFAELAAAFGGKKDIIGEQRASAVKGLRKIAEGAADVALAKGITVKELVKDYVKRMGMNIPDDVIDEALAEPIVKEVKEEVKVEKQAQPTKESAKELIEAEIEKGKEGERKMGKRILLDETKLPRELKDKYEGKGLNKYKKLKDVHAKAIVDELVRSNSTEVLETISTDKSIDQSIRVRVQVELAKEYSKQTEKALKDGDTESADYYADKNLAIVKELSDESSNTGRGLRAYGIAEVTALISPYSASKSYKDAVQESRDEIIERKSTKKAQKKFESEANEMHGKILEEVLKNPEFKKKVEALLKKDKAKEPAAPRKPVAKEKIAEIKVKRKSLIEQWKKERKGEVSASVIGLKKADIEFGARIASTYIEEGYYRASDITKKLIQDFKEAGVKLSEEDALKMIPKEIDGKKLEDMESAVETEQATTALASRIFGEVVEGKKKNDPLAQMVSTLLGKFKERDVTTKTKPERKSDIEKISEAIQNQEQYKEVWADARDKAIEKVEGDKKLTEDEIEDAVSRINEAYTSATEFTFTEDQVKKAVKKKMRDMDVRIDDVVKSHYSKQASTREVLKKSLVDEAGLSEADAEVLSKSIDKAYSSLLSEKAQKLVTKYVDKKALKRDDKSASMKRKGSIDELIELTNARAFDSKEFKEAFADAHGLPVMSDEAVRYIQDMSDLIQRTPSAVVKGRRVEDLMAYMANLKGVDTKELTDMIWYSHVLSGMTTQLRNIIGAQSNTVGALVVEGIKNPSSMHMIYKGWKHGLKTGKIKALDIGKHGKVGFETRVDVPNIGERVKFKGAESFMNYYKYVTRTMSAFDQLAISEGKEGMARLLTAEAQNINQLKYVTSKKYRDATNKLVDEMLYIDKDSQAKFEKQAKQEAEELGWNKEEQQLRELELMDEARGADITEESTTFAERNTGNVMAYGNIGWIVDTISKVFKAEYKKVDKRGDVHRRYIPILNKVAAFTRLPANVATFMMDFVPVAGAMPLATGEYGSLSRAGSIVGSKQNAKYVREMSPKQRETLWKRQLTGLVAQGLMYALSAPDDNGESAIQITANGTGKYYDKTSDFKPYSIKIGDTWIGYKYTPLMLALAPIGYVRDAKKYRNDDSDPLTLAGSAIGAMPSFLGDMTSISAMTDLLKSITDDEGAKGIEKRLKLAAMTVKPYYAPGILRDIEALYDWTAENPNYQNLDMYDRMISKAPIASMLLPDGRQFAVNALGESVPVEAPWAEFISGDNENDLEAYHVAQVHKPIRVPAKFSVTLTMRQKNGRDVNRPVTDGFKEDHELWYQFQKIRGKKIAEFIRNAKADGKKGEDYKNDYDSKSREATEYAKQKIWLMTLDKPIENLD